MKLSLALFIFLFCFGSCNKGIAQLQKAETGKIEYKPITKIQFDSSNYHFGSMMEGQILNKEIWFTNTGFADLQIEMITACECTTLDWSRLPIKAGERSKIKLSYNSKEKVGPQTVDIELIANTNPSSNYTKFNLEVKKLSNK